MVFGARSVFPGVGGGELCGLGLWGHAGVTLDHRRAADGALDLQSVRFCHLCVVTALCLCLSVCLSLSLCFSSPPPPSLTHTPSHTHKTHARAS